MSIKPNKLRMAGIALLAVSFFGLALSGCAQLQTTAPGGPEVIGDTLIVALIADSQLGPKVKQAASQRKFSFLGEQRLSGLGLVMLSFDRPQDLTPKEAIDALEAAVPGTTVGINHAYRLEQSATAVDRRNYANTALGWTKGPCRAAGPVGLIDTGVDRGSPGVAATKVVAQRFAPGDPAASTHGTNVASILADRSRLTGVTIYNADVMSADANLGVAAGANSLIRALDWFAANRVRAVNMSLSGPYNKLLDVAVKAADARGMILVSAVGNSGPNAPAQYPAGFPSVIAVTAVDANQRLYRQAVRGTHVNLAAPGVDIFVEGRSGGRFVTGTSMAAPLVTARVVAERGLLGAPNAGVLLQRLSTQTIDLGAKGVDAKFGAGLIQGPTGC